MKGPITYGDPPRIRQHQENRSRDLIAVYEQALLRIANGAENPVQIAIKVLTGASG